MYTGHPLSSTVFSVFLFHVNIFEFDQLYLYVQSVRRSKKSTVVVRPWELSPVIAIHQPSFHVVPTANDSVQSNECTYHTDSGYFSESPRDPLTCHHDLVCSFHLYMTLHCRPVFVLRLFCSTKAIVDTLRQSSMSQGHAMG